MALRSRSSLFSPPVFLLYSQRNWKQHLDGDLVSGGLKDADPKLYDRDHGFQNRWVIFAMLAKAKAAAILTEFEEGIVSAISFRISTEFGVLTFRLPANAERIYQVIVRDRRCLSTRGGVCPSQPGATLCFNVPRTTLYAFGDRLQGSVARSCLQTK
jgi:hypothetical protein